MADVSEQHIDLTAADYLDSVLRSRGMTQEQLARHAGVSQKHVSQVLTGKVRISPTIAARFQYGVSQVGVADPTLAEMLLVVQARVDAHEAVAALP